MLLTFKFTREDKHEKLCKTFIKISKCNELIGTNFDKK